ncbi:hypothetical protein [Myroides sp. N17-2]|uniref:hypothetical protein n=1 Tax=Myroides sp. N17-2 TaxID=2030799 RepID=UPI000EFAD22D|nr:hypothetical protein [Myroides sp. N17-2]
MRKIYFTIVVISLLLGSCAKKMYSPYSDSQLVNHTTQGSLTLRGIGNEVDGKNGKAKEEAIKLAHKKAIQQLLYFGFVGTDFKNPIIREGVAVESKHKAYFDKFWSSGYQRFVTDSKSDFYDCAQKSNCVSAVSVFTLNYNMLRKELEDNKIINKIGF